MISIYMATGDALVTVRRQNGSALWPPTSCMLRSPRRICENSRPPMVELGGWPHLSLSLRRLFGVLFDALFGDMFLATFIRLAIYSNPLYALSRRGRKRPSERPNKTVSGLGSRQFRRAISHAMRPRVFPGRRRQILE